ncbi:hypothetical protein Trydic_g12577 [Trypoxylus dichotomus]
MADEITSVIKNETWKLVNRPVKDTIIGSRIVLRNKFKVEGTLDRRKALMVAQGFSKTSYSFSMSFWHEDTSTRRAYLNGILEEEIYMEPPSQFREILISRSSKYGGQIAVKAKLMLKDLEGNVCRLE